MYIIFWNASPVIFWQPKCTDMRLHDCTCVHSTAGPYLCDKSINYVKGLYSTSDVANHPFSLSEQLWPGQYIFGNRNCTSPVQFWLPMQKPGTIFSQYYFLHVSVYIRPAQVYKLNHRFY